MDATQSSVLYKPEECARRLSCGRSTIYELINTGDLVRVKLGRAARITSESVDAYVARLVEAAGDGRS